MTPELLNAALLALLYPVLHFLSKNTFRTVALFIFYHLYRERGLKIKTRIYSGLSNETSGRQPSYPPLSRSISDVKSESEDPANYSGSLQGWGLGGAGTGGEGWKVLPLKSRHLRAEGPSALKRRA